MFLLRLATPSSEPHLGVCRLDGVTGGVLFERETKKGFRHAVRQRIEAVGHSPARVAGYRGKGKTRVPLLNHLLNQSSENGGRTPAVKRDDC